MRVVCGGRDRGAAGRPVPEAIATRLVVSDRTVEAHMAQVFSKLGLEESPDAHRRVLAVLALLRA